MTTNTNAALISHLQALGDRAYCDYIAKMKTNECLGWEEKVRTKKFGQAELTAHTKAGELLGKHRAFAEAVAALTTAAAVPAEGVVMVPVELAKRVQESLGEFLMDHGWSQRDMDTSDDFGAVLLAAAPKAEPVPAGEREELREGASYESMNLAVMVLSDCGHSSNYIPLLERVAGRIDRHVERLLTVQQADRAMRKQAAPACKECEGTGTVAGSQAHFACPQCKAAPAAVASPLTKLQRKAIAVFFTSDKVSVSEVQRKLSISYADAQTLCQSIVDLGLTDELELAPSLKQRGAPAPQAAPVAQGDALTDTYVQQVPDKCDRIVWRGRYYHLPIDAAEHSYTEPSPMAKVAAALRQKAEQEDATYQARRSDQGLMESEWGPMEDAPPHEDPPMHVAVVEGDDTVRTLQWNRDVAAFAYPAGTLLYAAHPAAPVAQGDAEAAAREAHSRR